MTAKENSESASGVLLGIVVALMITVFVCAGAGLYCYRAAEQAKLLAEVARAEAAASALSEHASQERGDLLAQNRDAQIFFAQYYKHVFGVHTLSDPELNVVRPILAGDEQMAVVLQTFEADMASVNQLLAPDRQVSNYHDAIVACCALLEKEGN